MSLVTYQLKITAEIAKRLDDCINDLSAGLNIKSECFIRSSQKLNEGFLQVELPYYKGCEPEYRKYFETLLSEKSYNNSTLDIYPIKDTNLVDEKLRVPYTDKVMPVFSAMVGCV